MLVDAVVLCAIGIVAILLPTIPSYRARLVQRVARRAGATIPAGQVPTLDGRAARRARAMGAGILAAGIIWLAVTLLWPEGGGQPSGGYVVVSLAFVFGAGGLALVEVLRPGDVAGGPRWARTTVPTFSDYVAPQARVLHWTFIAIGVGVLVLTMLLSLSRWFDAPTIWRSPALFLLAAVPVLTVLSQLAVRRVLDVPQPARDTGELYWQDALRADTLSTLTVPPALVSLLAVTVSGATLDDAASAAAIASGQVGPTWSLWLLIAGYVMPFLLIAGFVGAVAAISGTGSETEHFRRRLWPAGPPVAAPTGDA